MAQDRPIIIKRKKIIQTHHGGSWKIALADFMTALMALFLVLWLVSVSSESELEGIAEYFSTPLLVAITGGERPTSSVQPIPGGGADPMHRQGEVANIDLRLQTRPANIQQNLMQVQRSFMELQRRIENAVMADQELREIRDQMHFYLMSEGLLIQLVDTERRAMFQRGSDRVEPYMSRLLRTMAPLLNDLPNRISISGHTDSHPYPGENRGYSNWELSTDRANASRRELMAGGLDDIKLLRVTGMADGIPLEGTDPTDPVNRRIELMVLDEYAAARIRLPALGPENPSMEGEGAAWQLPPGRGVNTFPDSYPQGRDVFLNQGGRP